MMIFERIAAYEAAFRRCGTGLRMAKLLSYLSEPEVEVLKLMNLDHVTDPDRLEKSRVARPFSATNTFPTPTAAD